MQTSQISSAMLGETIYEEFVGRSGAVLPRLNELVRAQPDEVLDVIAQQWHITGVNVPKTIGEINKIKPNEVAHSRTWDFLWRVAQCAASTDKRLVAHLEPLSIVAEDPYVLAIESIHALGQRALGLLEETTGVSFPFSGLDTDNWDPRSKVVIDKLKLKPTIFRDAFMDFGMLAAPEQLPLLLRDGPRGSMWVLYRMATAAAVIGYGVQIEFVPFDQGTAATA